MEEWGLERMWRGVIVVDWWIKVGETYLDLARILFDNLDIVDETSC